MTKCKKGRKGRVERHRITGPESGHPGGFLEEERNTD